MFQSFGLFWVFLELRREDTGILHFSEPVYVKRLYPEHLQRQTFLEPLN